MHALIIEDDALIGLHLRFVLEEVGFSSFDHANTQAEAIILCRLHRPDFITADVRLAKGSGIDAVDEIAREFGPIPVVFVTGNAGLLSGRTDPIFRKPFSEEQFCMTVAQIFAALTDASPTV